jgi:hypothetical protein
MDAAERRPVGRPRRDDAVRALALARIRAVLDAGSWSASAREVHRALAGEVSRGLVLEIWKELRDERARVLREQRAGWSRHTHVSARDALWSLDGTHVGRDLEGDSVIAELVRDVGSTMTKGHSTGNAPTSAEVARLLERIRQATGTCPLVLARDNGAENLDAVDTWCKEQRVIVLRNLWHVPQHNPWVEHGNAEIKHESGLGKGVRIDSIVLASRTVAVALDYIDGVRRRPTRDMRTAREAYAEMPAADAMVDRTAFYAETCCAIRAAVEGWESGREQRLAERQAILNALERYGVLTQTRGRRAQPLAKEEGVS